MKGLYLLCVAALSVLLTITCRKDSGPHVVLPLQPVPVSFSQDIQPIFNANCISCHDESHAYLNLKTCCSWYELWTTGFSAPYLDTIAPLQSLLHKRISGAQLPIMPPMGQMQQGDIDLVARWITEGARNN